MYIYIIHMNISTARARNRVNQHRRVWHNAAFNTHRRAGQRLYTNSGRRARFGELVTQKLVAVRILHEGCFESRTLTAERYISMHRRMAEQWPGAPGTVFQCYNNKSHIISLSARANCATIITFVYFIIILAGRCFVFEPSTQSVQIISALILVSATHDVAHTSRDAAAAWCLLMIVILGKDLGTTLT